MQGVLDKIGANFIAAFVPSLAFVTFGLLFFSPIIPPKVMELITTSFAPFFEEPQAPLILLLTTILGFSLFSLNTYIYKLMEGYFILQLFPWTTRFQRRKARNMLAKIKLLDLLLENDQWAKENPTLREKVESARFQAGSRFYLDYPPSLDLILPTRFGNIFRSLETYSGLRYKIESILLWPRMVHVIPDSYFKKIEQSNNHLAFLVNSSILSLVMMFAFLGAAGYEFLLLKLADKGWGELLYFIPIEAGDKIKYQQNAYIYLAGMVIMMALFVLLYKASLPVANQYGNLVRSSFDLFRLPLLKELRLKMPEEYLDELTLWRDVSHFMGLGYTPMDEDLPFDYQAAQNAKGADSTGNSSSG